MSQQRRTMEGMTDVPHGLDLVKAMPADWTDEQRLAAMVEHYDRLRYQVHEAPDSGRSVVEAAADTALARSQRLSLDEVCERLGIDPADIDSQEDQ